MATSDKITPYAHADLTACTRAVNDALYALNGKWKLPLVNVLVNGPKRFNEIQKELGDITPKALTKELRELEINEFVKRTSDGAVPPNIVYELTPYSESLDDIIQSLRDWGTKHRERIISGRKK